MAWVAESNGLFGVAQVFRVCSQPADVVNVLGCRLFAVLADRPFHEYGQPEAAIALCPEQTSVRSRVALTFGQSRP